MKGSEQCLSHGGILFLNSSQQFFIIVSLKCKESLALFAIPALPRMEFGTQQVLNKCFVESMKKTDE